MDEERFIRAVALRDAGKEEDALREFESLGSQASDEREKSNLLANQANCLWRMRRLTEARQRWSEATITETTPVTELLDAWLCLSEGKDEEAVQKLTLFVRNHVDLKQSACKGLYADAQDELGKLLFGLGSYSQAIDPLKEALIFAEPGRRKKLCFYLGVCYSRDGNGKAAEERLIESLPVDRRDPFWAQAQYQLGCLYFQRSAYLKAKTAFEMCACFLDDDDDMKEEVLDWLSQTRVKLGQSG